MQVLNLCAGLSFAKMLE